MSFTVLGLNTCPNESSPTAIRTHAAPRTARTRRPERTARATAAFLAAALLLALPGAAGQAEAQGMFDVSLSVSPTSWYEELGNKIVTVTATASRTPVGNWSVPVTVGASGDSATNGTDYAADTSITISGTGQTISTTFQLLVYDDTDVEGDETISIVPGSVSGANNTSGTTMTLIDDDTPPTVSLSLSPSSVSEGAGATSVAVTATLNEAWSEATTVNVSVGSDSATEGTDFAAVSAFTLTVPANQTSASANFTLTPTDDSAVEGDETIKVSGRATVPSQQDPLKLTGARLTITDNDQHTVALSASPSSVSEGAGATTVTVTATLSSAQSTAYGVIATVGKNSDSAVSGTDYSVNHGQFFINIPANQTSATNTFTLTPTDDSTVEGDETITVSGTSSGLSVTDTSLTLTDNDKPAITLSVTPSTVGEEASQTTFSITATAASAVSSSGQVVTVTVGASGDSATKDTDYTTTTATFEIDIKPNQTSGTRNFTLTPTQDTAFEGSETITLAGAATGYAVTGTSLTLTDDDKPAITLSVTPSSVGEGASQTTFSVTATAASAVSSSGQVVTVTVGASGDTATKDTDYTTTTPIFEVDIPPNGTSGTRNFTLTPTQDTVFEGSETITLAGAATGYTVTDTSLTLTDDDTYAVVLSASPTSVNEADSATTVTVTATADSAISTARAVMVSVSGGSADFGTDYAGVGNFPVTIEANATSGTGTFTLTPTQDTEVEGDESINVWGQGADMTVTQTSLTLTDDDTYAVALSASPTSVGEADSETTVTVTATAATAVAKSRTVTVAVGGGTATSGTDYAAVSSFDIAIAANATSGTGTFTLTPTQDTSVEGDETITVSGSGTNMSVTAATLTLTDDDREQVYLAVSPSSVGEGAQATKVTVTARVKTASSTARSYALDVGASGDGATEGTDYETVNAFQITIPANKVSGTAEFTLTPKQDTAVEGNETISVSGGGVNGQDVVGTTLTLTDDDSHSITLSASPSTVREDDGNKQIQVTATLGQARDVMTPVTISVGDASDKAKAGEDYQAVDPVTLRIRAGQTTGAATFQFRPMADEAMEGLETITISGTVKSTSKQSRMQGVAAAAVGGSTIPVTSTSMTLDDSPQVVSLTLSPASVGEGDEATTVTVTAAFPGTWKATADQTVTVSVGASGTATSGTDYAAVSDFDVTIAKGQNSGTGTFTLTPTQDTLVEGNETIAVTGSATGLTVHAATDVTLTDDDGAPAVNLTLSPASVGEADGATTVTVTAAFSNSSTYAGDTTVTVSVGASGTATAGTDFGTVQSFDVTIPAGATSGTADFIITPTDDTVVEGNETIGVAGSASGLTVNSADLTLTDDDGAAAVNLTLSPASVGEADGATTVAVTAAFSNSSTYADDQTVTVAVGAGGTATVGTDFAAVQSFDVTIPAGAASGTANFAFTPTDDTLVEGNETVSVTGSAVRPDGQQCQPDADRQRRGVGRQPDAEPGERGRGGRGDDGHCHRGLLERQHLRRRPDRHGRGGRERHGHRRDRLRRGAELRCDHPRRGGQRHGQLRLHADRRHPGRG